MDNTLFTTLTVAGDSALETLSLRRESYAQSGEYPFLIGTAEDLDRLQESAEYNDQEVEDILGEVVDFDLEAWLQERRQEAEEYEFSEEDILGDWPGEIADKGAISMHRDLLTNALRREVFIGIAKVKEAWHLPAILKYGDWNACPSPQVHCAIHKQWANEFGAEIVSISGDVIECIVKNPPRDMEAAIRLAWQQYWYCPDIVDQGCEKISNLAGTLLHSGYWYFWWD